jgi:hypothetical protein
MSINKKNLKAFINKELIDMGLLEDGTRIDVESTFKQYGLTEHELESLVVAVEDYFGITFSDEFNLETAIKDVLEFSFEN